MTTRTRADRLDEAVAGLLAGDRPSVDPELAPLVDAAALIRAALSPMPVGARFSSRLEARLVRRRRLAAAAAAISDVTRRELRQPGRLAIAGVISSAVIGVGLTALALWIGTRRHAATGVPPAHR
ncbi:MAG: hypothetical protein OEW24_02155 [Chloroflexota bacterium]|nr:hypothetical protein [Chloroflexota bacterium]